MKPIRTIVAAAVLAAILPLLPASATDARVRVVTSSAPLQLTVSDEAIGLLRLADPKPTIIHVPVHVAPGYQVTIDDLAGNAATFPITIELPPGNQLPGGASAVILNVDGQEATLRFFGTINGAGMWGGRW